MLGSNLGPYRILERLGSGAMGTVYRASDLDRSVAVKVFHPHLLEQVGFLERFRREAKAGRLVFHPNVVRTLDFGAARLGGMEYQYLVMEYVEGTTFRDTIEVEGLQAEAFLREIGRQVARGLAAIHEQGIVHRDLKPENVLITTAEEVKIMDLGIALLKREALRLSAPGDFVGSVLYAAPEQIERAGGELDGRADLYSLGLILYELAAGDLPCYDGDAVRVLDLKMGEGPRRLGEVREAISPFFEEVVHTLLSRRPEDRFDRAEDLVTVLEQGEASVWWLARSGEKPILPKRPARRIRVARDTGVHGRTRELTRLRAHFDAAADGRGQVVLLEGEAGVGKTRLVDEFVAGLEAEEIEFDFLYGAYPPGGAATATGAFCTAYREHFGTEHLDRALEEHLPDTPGLRAGFAAILRGEPPPPGVAALDREGAQTAFARVTQNLSGERPVLVVIDDLQLAPEEGRGLFAALTWAVAGLRVLLVGTTRPGLPESWLAGLTRLEQVAHLSAPRLDDEAISRIVTERFRAPELAAGLGPRVATWSDGNPYFVFEILRGLIDCEMITRTVAGSWALNGDLERFPMPASVKDMIQARISGLDEDERALLDVAACAGFEFDPVLVGRAQGLGPVAVLRRLGQLERGHRLVHPTGETFTFDHHLVRETLYEALHDGLRESYHRDLGEALELTLGGPDLDPAALEGDLPVTLCDHFLRARMPERAEPFVTAAMDHLEENGLVVSALELGERALETTAFADPERRLPMLLRVADLLDVAGRRRHLDATLEEALRLADGRGDLLRMARARRLLASSHRLAARHDRAQELILEAIAMAGRAGDPREEASAALQQGNLAADVARFDAAREAYERALALARAAGDRGEEAKALGSLGLVSYEEGRPEDTLRLGAECLEAFREIGDPLGEIKALGTLGVAYLSLGRNEAAGDEFERQADLARDYGYRRGEAIATGNLGHVSMRRGRLEEALRLFDHELAVTRSMGDVSPRTEALYAARVSHVLTRTGRSTEARDVARRSLEISRDIGDRSVEAYSLECLGLALEQLDLVSDAVDSLEEAIAVRGEGGDRRDLGLVLLGLGGVLVRAGAEDGAADRFRDALAVGQETGHPAVTIRAAAYLARLGRAPVAGPRAAFAEHADTMAVFDRMEAAFVLHRAREDRALLESAHEILMEVREHAPPGDREMILTEVPLHREILACVLERERV